MDGSAHTRTEFDGDGILAAFGGDVGDVRDLLGLVAATVPKYVTDLRQAAGSGDARRTAAAAHTLRGAVGNIGAARVAALTRDIECAARAGEAVPAALLDGVERAARELMQSMSAWADTLVARGPGAGRR